MTAPIATGWSDPVAGRESHPLTISALSRRTIKGRVEMWRGGGEPLRFHIPLIKPDMPISSIRLSGKDSCVRTREATPSLNQVHQPGPLKESSRPAAINTGIHFVLPA